MPLPPPPFYAGKDTGAFVSGDRGEKNPTKNCSIYADIGKKNKWQIIFQKKPKKTRLFLANKLPSLWEAASSAQPQPAGKTKGSLGGAAAGNAGRRPGEGRENAGSAARHSAAAPGAARAQLTFQSSWFSIECPSPPFFLMLPCIQSRVMIKIRPRAASGGLSCILAQMGLIPSAGGSLPKDISEWKEFKKSGILHITELYLSHRGR